MREEPFRGAVRDVREFGPRANTDDAINVGLNIVRTRRNFDDAGHDENPDAIATPNSGWGSPLELRGGRAPSEFHCVANLAQPAMALRAAKGFPQVVFQANGHAFKIKRRTSRATSFDRAVCPLSKVPLLKIGAPLNILLISKEIEGPDVIAHDEF